MSTYENYESSSATYTGMRVALGWRKELAHFAGNKIPLAEQRLLDAGCGTGNYSVHLAGEFGSIHACDFSKGMLAKAVANVETAKANGNKIQAEVTFSQEDITSMPGIQSESFDALCNNQVLHHLSPADNFAALRKAVAEFYRILKPGGRGVINFCLPDQCCNAIWWAAVIPDAFERWAPRSTNEKQLRSILEEAGFQDIQFVPLIEEIPYSKELYFNPKYFLDIEKFKKIDSAFALCTGEELAKGVAEVKRLIDSGEMDAWFKKREELRLKYGQTTNVLFVGINGIMGLIYLHSLA